MITQKVVLIGYLSNTLSSATSISVGQHNVSLITEQEHTIYVYRQIKMFNAKMVR
jgi:hypothetical protein